MANVMTMVQFYGQISGRAFHRYVSVFHGNRNIFFSDIKSHIWPCKIQGGDSNQNSSGNLHVCPISPAKTNCERYLKLSRELKYGHWRHWLRRTSRYNLNSALVNWGALIIVTSKYSTLQLFYNSFDNFAWRRPCVEYPQATCTQHWLELLM